MQNIGAHIYNGALSAYLMSDVLNSLGGMIVGEIGTLGFNGRLDVLVFLLLLLLVWVPLGTWISRASSRFNHNSRHWNKFVTSAMSTVGFLLAYTTKTYAFQIVLQTQSLAIFTTATFITLLVLGLVAVTVFSIYFQEYMQPATATT